MGQKDGITRSAYKAWMKRVCGLAQKGLPHIDFSRYVNDNTGLVFDDYEDINDPKSQQKSAYERFAIFQLLNIFGMSGFPKAWLKSIGLGGLCVKVMVVEKGQFCCVHKHPRKTECYLVMHGTMHLAYSMDWIESDYAELNKKETKSGFIQMASHLPGDRRLEDSGIVLPPGREHFYHDLTPFHMPISAGDEVVWMPRSTNHAFTAGDKGAVILEFSSYSHEPTASAESGPEEAMLPGELFGIHDNVFVDPRIAEARLGNRFID